MPEFGAPGSRCGSKGLYLSRGITPNCFCLLERNGQNSQTSSTLESNGYLNVMCLCQLKRHFACRPKIWPTKRRRPTNRLKAAVSNDENFDPCWFYLIEDLSQRHSGIVVGFAHPIGCVTLGAEGVFQVSRGPFVHQNLENLAQPVY